MKISGHLAHSAGIRGHSAGEFYPFRVIAKGTFEHLRWHVVAPNGHVHVTGHVLVSSAFTIARLAHGLWSTQ